MSEIKVVEAKTSSGLKALLVIAVLAAAGVGILLLAGMVDANGGASVLAAILLVAGISVLLVGLSGLAGLYMLQPNKAAVLTLFGDYKGTDTTSGLRFASPLLSTRKVSLRVRNFTTSTSKVNDANGNPIEIAAVVVWKVADTSLAIFGVDDFEDYVYIQSEAGVRQLARSYPYDNFEEGEVKTLIGETEEVNQHLLSELQERASEAGVEVLEARITDLSYAPEIAEAMLRRQQASAIVAARAKIVEGAVLMVREAIEELAKDTDGQDAIELDPDRKATFASNLMTVIASDQPTNPIVNVGTLSR